MRKKIDKCVNDSYELYADFNSSLAVELLEQLFDEEILSFISFLRKNYSTLDPDMPYECYQLNDTFWQNEKTGEVEQITKIYKNWKIK